MTQKRNTAHANVRRGSAQRSAGSTLLMVKRSRLVRSMWTWT